MKLLLSADPHFRTDWFRWLMEQAPSYDLICIAGDLLDMFNVESPKGQAREVSILIRRLADIVPKTLADSMLGFKISRSQLYRPLFKSVRQKGQSTILDSVLRGAKLEGA
jgi:hypothetical protein